ncbi:MAG: XRE family transcriptional regulator, partial [Micromonosporaceae bacterium]
MTSNGSQRRWLSVRRYLNASRAALTATASHLAEEWPRVEPGLIAYPEWLPDRPVPLDQVRLDWVADPPPPRVTGTEAESFLVRPLRPDGQRYDSYAEALADVDPPALLDNRPCYRLLTSTADPGGGARLGLAAAHYFDGINVAEAVAHELAAVWMASGDRGGRADVMRTDLPLRARLGDPGDLAARTVVPALCTLTVRHDADSGDASFLLHWRDPARVASGGGMYQVAPVGVFQPAGGAKDPGDPLADPDFDLWRCMAREMHEELLGAAEHRGLDYRDWPFLGRLEEAREKAG